MNFLAGVDEAGLGPILGPLVVAGTALQGPGGQDPWRLLRRHVARGRTEKGKVRVADSKKVHQGPHGLRHLEETALVFWVARHGELPATLGDWLRRLGVDVVRLARCPWYEDLALPLPRTADAAWITLQGELVARALRHGDAALLDIVVRAVDVEEWNELIAATDNKSRAHFVPYADVLGRLLRLAPAAAAGHVVADRCGGRMHYGHALAELGGGAAVDVLREEPAESAYRMRGPGGELLVTFAERAEDRSFPTALASCVAKYVRELMVECLNRWCCARVPALKPTAGYHQDGQRFLAELTPHLPGDLPRNRLVRVR